MPARADKMLKEQEDALMEALSSLKGKDEIVRFLYDLCTRQEIAAFSERWEIARLLADGELSYRDISAETGASTTTIARVARFLQNEPHQGYRMVLERLNGKGRKPVKPK